MSMLLSRTRRVPLADVLWDAANLHLQHKNYTYGWDVTKDSFSCFAVTLATHGRIRNTNPIYIDLDPAIKFLYELGCAYDCSAVWGKQRNLQGTRYMWLLIAMHVAEDEGIEVEVTA